MQSATFDSLDVETRLTANLINVASLLWFAKSEGANFTQRCTSYLKPRNKCVCAYYQLTAAVCLVICSMGAQCFWLKRSKMEIRVYFRGVTLFFFQTRKNLLSTGNFKRLFQIQVIQFSVLRSSEIYTVVYSSSFVCGLGFNLITTICFKVTKHNNRNTWNITEARTEAL